MSSTSTEVTVTRTEEVVTNSASTDTTVNFDPTTTDIDGTTFTMLTTTGSTDIPDSTTLYTIPKFETAVTVEPYETVFDIDGSSVTVTVPGVTTGVTMETTETMITFSETTTMDVTFSNISGTTEGTPTSFDVITTINILVTTMSFTPTPSETVVTVNIPATTTIVTLSKVSTVTTETIISIPEQVTSYTVGVSDESSTTEESTTSEESSITEESTTSEESTTTEESISSEGSSITGESSTTSEESSSTSGTATSPTASAPTSNPTYCEIVRGPLTPEEEVQLQVLFSNREGASAFADYVVSYASQLVAQIVDVANIAIEDNDYAFTTAFENVDYPGILGLASAAPLYTCFLSSLWAVALSNPQQYAKRAVPTQDDKIKLIVLFEKHENAGMQFDYAELLVDETNDLIAEVQSVSAAAANGDLGAYASLFANVDVPYFLSIATEAPVYTEGLSAALQTALESYSQSMFRPTVTTMTTRTFTTVSTIVTNVVSGTVIVPTTLYSTVVVTSLEPVGGSTETYAGTSETSEIVSEVVRESTQPNGQVTRITERVTVGAPGERVTVEVATAENGRVETRTVTRREGGAAAAATTAITVTKPNVAIYTQVQNGVTYTHTVEIQTKNAAFKEVAAMGAGLLGVAALLF